MKVFEIKIEYCEEGDSTIIETTKYVTSLADSLKSVVDYHHQFCEEFGRHLISVKEVLVVSNHIGEKEICQCWVDVNDRMPKDDTTVLVYEGSQPAFTAFFYKGYWRLYGNVKHVLTGVTHWMPIPEFYEK